MDVVILVFSMATNSNQGRKKYWIKIIPVPKVLWYDLSLLIGLYKLSTNNQSVEGVILLIKIWSLNNWSLAISCKYDVKNEFALVNRDGEKIIKKLRNL